MKTTLEKIRDYSRNASEGKTSSRLSNLRGAMEIESASQYNYRTSQGMLRQVVNAPDLSVGTDSTIETTCDYDNENELRLNFHTSELQRSFDVVDKFSEYTQANHSCGLHFHIKASDLIGRSIETPSGRARLAQVLIPLVSVCKRFENAFYSASGNRLRKNSEWSQAWNDSNFDRLKLARQNPTLDNLAESQPCRTAFLNLRNLRNGNYSPNERTIEFRCFSASTSQFDEEFEPTSALHVESSLFLILNALSACLSETSKPLEKLRFDLKHPSHEKSLQWFFHHCAKRPQIERWKNTELVRSMITYLWEQARQADDVIAY